VLRDWWQHGEMAKNGSQLEDAIEKFSALSEYLGDEIVVSGETAPSHSTLFIVAPIRKPGLRDFLLKMLKDFPQGSKSDVRILDVQQLANARIGPKANGLVILVRPDFVIAGTDTEAVSKINDFLETKRAELGSTPFGQRIEKSYAGGTTSMAAADLHKILTQLPSTNPATQKTLDKSGISDVKYFVWDHKRVAGQSLSQTELSFLGPRRGIASWLASPAPFDSLDFISPKSAFVLALQLKNLGDIFDDIKDLSASSNSPAFAMLTPMEQAMHISFKDDVFGQLQGEVALELQNFELQQMDGPQPVWSVVLRVVDSDRLQKALDRLIRTMPLQPQQFDQDGVHYQSLVVPSRPKPKTIVYAFADGYLIVASSRETIANAIRVRKSGDSLAKSSALASSVPLGYSPESSLLLYQNAPAFTNLRLQQLSPDLANAISRVPSDTPPVTFRAYAEDNAIRGVSASAGVDVSAVLVGAAVAIPNLLRARIAANESSAVAALRTVNTAQIAYTAEYPELGFARDLATLGPDPGGATRYSQEHAGFLDATLGGPECGLGKWCLKSGYRFSLTTTCIEHSCPEYVVVATPDSSSAGNRNFCSTSDAVIRFQVGPSLSSPVSASRCKRWPRVQ